MSGAQKHRLVTKCEWLAAEPFDQGYVLYMQAALPGSELKGLKNPHRQGSPAWAAFEEGELQAVMDVTDVEE